MSTQLPTVLIVGAGPTGLCAAVELARRGIVADLIEKRDGVSNLSRAVGILPASLDILEPSGVAAAIRNEAIHIDQVIFHQRSREVVRLNLKDQGAPLDFVALAQDRTEAHLIDAFERYGGQVHYGRTLHTLTQDEQGVTAKIDTEEKRYDYVIGADGVRSAVRGSLNVAFNGFEIEGLWSIADVDCADWSDPKSFKAYLLDNGGVVIVVPMEATRYRVIANSEDALAVLPVPMKVTNIRRTAAFPISVRQVEQYSVGCVFLAGDAAHCHSPAGGRGMNLGIADSADLARRMAEGELDGYHSARHATGVDTIAFSERARKFFTSNNKLTRWSMLAGLRAITLLPPARRAIIRGFLQMEKT